MFISLEFTKADIQSAIPAEKWSNSVLSITADYYTPPLVLGLGFKCLICTSSWVSSDGLSSVGFVKLASIAATEICLLPSGPIQPGCNIK